MKKSKKSCSQEYSRKTENPSKRSKLWAQLHFVSSQSQKKREEDFVHLNNPGHYWVLKDKTGFPQTLQKNLRSAKYLLSIVRFLALPPSSLQQLVNKKTSVLSWSDSCWNWKSRRIKRSWLKNNRRRRERIKPGFSKEKSRSNNQSQR